MISSSKVAQLLEPAQPKRTQGADERIGFTPPATKHGNLLLIAFHFPPQAGSSGMLRSLKFCRYLPEFGWEPTVLTVHPRAYERVDDSQLSELPPNLNIVRAFGFDTRRHLSFRRAYPNIFALPDRWVTWALGAVPAGLSAIRKRKVDVIFSTYPIATAILIGYILHRLTGKPWIVDFRDSMTEDNYPQNRLTWRVYRWIELKAVRHAAKILFTAPGTIRMYCKRYPELDANQCVLLPNGYDEVDFEAISAQRTPRKKLRLLHSGLVYPWERDPRPFFRALSRLKREGRISAETISVDLRACGAEDEFRKDVAELDITGLVHFLAALPYRVALQDAADADALLLLQAACCDHQIPAKAYEYLRLKKPILALTSATGDTAALLNEAGGATIVDIADEEAIYRALPEFLEKVRTGAHAVTPEQKSRFFSRKSQAERLADCLREIAPRLKAGPAKPRTG